MVKDSIFRPAYSRREKRTDLGFKYKDVILKKTLSTQLFNVSPIIDTFLTNLNKVVYEWFSAVKQIKIFASPALDKYDDKIN
jgi:hypothetical protein